MSDVCMEYNARTKKHPGRPTILEDFHMTHEELFELYKRLGSVRKTAAELGVCVNTILKHLKGEMHPVGRPRNPYPWKRQVRHPFQDWLENYKGELPRSPRKIAELSGFSASAVERWFRRRAHGAQAYLESLGDLREKAGVVLLDTQGRRILAGMLADYKYTVDYYNLVVTVQAVFKFGGTTTCKLSFKRAVELLSSKEDVDAEDAGR